MLQTVGATLTADVATRLGVPVGDRTELAAWVHVKGPALDDAAIAVVRDARFRGTRISVDPGAGPPTDRLVEALLAADVLLPGEGDLASLGIDPDALLAGGAIVCTRYADGGASVRDGEEIIVVDPAAGGAGAGDAFAAGFIAAAMAGADPVDAARAGSRVAAVSPDAVTPALLAG